MKVYVAIEEDRGMGPMVLGVSMHKHEAEKAACGSHDFVQEEDLDIESLIRDCCDGETRDDIISSFANRLGMPELLELI